MFMRGPDSDLHRTIAVNDRAWLKPLLIGAADNPTRAMDQAAACSRRDKLYVRYRRR